jgi:hypothetical protein
MWEREMIKFWLAKYVAEFIIFIAVYVILSMIFNGKGDRK